MPDTTAISLSKPHILPCKHLSPSYSRVISSAPSTLQENYQLVTKKPNDFINNILPVPKVTGRTNATRNAPSRVGNMRAAAEGQDFISHFFN